MAADALDPDSTGDDLDGMGYAAAVAELEAILTQLDGDEIDVDHLAAQVRRAADLIALCRERLGAARVEVTRIVADLDGAEVGTEAEAGTGAAVGALPLDVDTDELDDATQAERDDADEEAGGA